MVSVIIPARNEQFLQATIDDVLRNAAGDVEVIVGLDGYWPKPILKDDPRVTIYHVAESIGMRPLINDLVAMARGEYLMKLDAHCALDKGWDEVLKADCDNDWIVIPRRYSLNVDDWQPITDKAARDYHYLTHPMAIVDEKGFGLHSLVWEERAKQRADVLIDDEMTSQGSCYFMHRGYWQDLDTVNYGWCGQESVEVCTRAWLSGGQVKVNKKTWYAHLWKGNKYPREFNRPLTVGRKSRLRSIELFFYENHGLQKPFEWLVDKFWPIPTWPDGWKQHKEGVHHAMNNVAMNEPVSQVTQPKSDTQDYIIKKYNLKLDKRVGIPHFTRNDMAALFGELGFKKGVEVGTREGVFSEVICKAIPGVELSCVDMWEYDAEYKSHRQFTNHSKNYIEAQRRLAPYGCKLIQAKSLDGATQFEDESLDFVYIDANHRYEYVVADIAAWLPKIRVGGIISGHDYKKFYKPSPSIGVRQAVDGFCSSYQIYPYFVFQTRMVDKSMPNKCGSWMWVRKGTVGMPEGFDRYGRLL